MQPEFGSLLREWRSLRRLSQLELGLEANVSARHISFLETGRSKPSRQMVMQLGETLGMPREIRNRMLEAAGFSGAFRRRSLESDEMVEIRRAAEWMIERHEPYPALALDRHWRIVLANRPAAALLGALGLGEGGSLLDLVAEPERGAAIIENWPEVARHMLSRLRAESARAGGDTVLDRAIAALAADPALGIHHGERLIPPFLPTRLRAGGSILSFISTLTHFTSAEDIALEDLRIELMFPSDASTRAFLHDLLPRPS